MTPRDAAVSIAMDLRQAGYEALLAGGCVRDEVLGHTPKDWDIATSATPDQVKAVCASAHGVGEAFGVMLVHRGGTTTEVATFRSDGTYVDGRRPTSVTYSTAEEDARRRDFTINALFRDPESGALIDHVGGLEDLSHGVIRAVGSAVERFSEDHLRMLRAVRFAASLGFTLDAQTADAIRALNGNLDGVSKERIGEEVRRMWKGDSAVSAATLMAELGMDDVVFGVSHTPPRHTHLAAAVRAGTDYAARLAGTMLDRGASAPESADELGGRLMLSNADREGCRQVLRTVADLGHWSATDTAARRRCVGRPCAEAACVLLAVDNEVAANAAATARADWAAAPGGVLPPRVLSGRALLDAGVPAGPQLGAWLEAIYDAQLAGRIADAESGLQMLHRLRDSAT
ncbi:MAG: CCA tRNA nucleotidyltransferase [Phycisphaerales bacterium]|nr:CCA tRNA nucleotidyltransferase [Phycisphaerales bacterium]